jgi:GT2 family glycosyltransferase
MTTTSHKPAVSILIVAYNSASLISACLNSIAPACVSAEYEVLLIDNGDGSTEALVRRDFPQVRTITSQGNVGFAAGNNILAREAKAPLLLLANPDLEMRGGAIDELLRASRRYPDAAAWGGVTLGRDGRPDIGNSVHVPSLGEMASRLIGRSNLRLDESDDLADDQLAPVLSGGFVMFPRTIWKDAGGLDERYFLYCEEVDLFYRLAQQGHHFWRIGSARVFHDAGHGNDFSEARLLYKAAGTAQFALIHWSRPRQIMGFALTWLNALLRYGLGALFGTVSPRLARISKGYRGVALKPGAWRHGYDPHKGLLARLGRR